MVGVLKLALLDQHALSPNGISRVDVPGSGESEPWNWLSSGPGGVTVKQTLCSAGLGLPS